MLSNFDLNHLLTFPLKDDEARKYFFIGALVYLAAFIIPIIPLLFATGYMMRIMRQVLKGEQPQMVAWGEWEEMFKDGARLFGVRLVYTLPIFLLLCPIFGFNIALPVLIENAGPDAEWIFLIFPMDWSDF